MKFEHIKIRDLGPFREVDLDLAAISGKVVAVVADDNGAGKSTLLELLPGALYRETATRGSLVDLATSRESFVEVRVTNGAADPWVVRQAVDAISGKGEALILDAGGEPQLSTTKLRDADAWVRAHFVAPEVLYTGAFLAQQSQGFLDLSAGERKQCLLRLLQGGIERLEAYAQSARERARLARGELDVAHARLVDARERYPDRKRAEEAHREARAAYQKAVGEREKFRVALDSARVSEPARAQRAAIAGRLTVARTQLADVEERIKNNRWLLEKSDEITAAVAELERLRVARDAALAQVALAGATENARAQVAQAAKHHAREALRRFDQLQARAAAAKERLADEAAVKRAVAALPTLKLAVTAATQVCDELEAGIEAAEKALVGSKDTRIKGLRGGLSLIAAPQRQASPATSNGKVQLAQRTLEGDYALAAQGKRAPAEITAMRAELGRANKDLAKATAKLDDLKAQAARAKDLKSAKQDHQAAIAELEQADTLCTEAGNAYESHNVQAKSASVAKAAAARALTKVTQAHIDQLPKCKHAPMLATAKARLEEQEPVAAQLRGQIVADLKALEALPSVDGPASDVDALAAQLQEWEQAEREAHELLTVCAERVTASLAGVDKIAALEVACCVENARLQNWTRLGQDCGREGIQAFEIDSALPELNTLANDLLHACFGTRFTVELRSSRSSADGKQQLEDLVVHVIDAVKGFAGDAARYSGGQRVIIGEAVALALTMLACRIAGLSHPTLVRDESGAALTPANARAYLTMLRRAAELIDADKVFFVTHNPELQALADARIVVRDGTATLGGNE